MTTNIIVPAVFIIVLVVSLRVLPEMGFTGHSQKTLAVCVAVLSAMGVAMLDASVWHALLIPYAALGLALLALLLLVFLIRLAARGTRQGKLIVKQDLPVDRKTVAAMDGAAYQGHQEAKGAQRDATQRKAQR